MRLFTPQVECKSSNTHKYELEKVYYRVGRSVYSTELCKCVFFPLIVATKYVASMFPQQLSSFLEQDHEVKCTTLKTKSYRWDFVWCCFPDGQAIGSMACMHVHNTREC